MHIDITSRGKIYRLHIVVQNFQMKSILRDEIIIMHDGGPPPPLCSSQAAHCAAQRGLPCSRQPAEHAHTHRCTLDIHVNGSSAFTGHSEINRMEQVRLPCSVHIRPGRFRTSRVRTNESRR